MRYVKSVLIIFVSFTTIISANLNYPSTNNQTSSSIINVWEIHSSVHKYFEEELKSDTAAADFDSADTINSNPDSSSADLTNTAYAKEVLKKYINAIGNEDSIRNVNDRITDMKGVVQGVQAEIIFYQKAPNKLCQKIIAGEVEQKIIFDGTKGVKIIGDTSEEITGDELIKLSFDAEMNLILDPESYGVKLQYKGLEKFNGRDAYTILLTLPNGSEWFQYYDMETGLKIRDSKDIVTPQGKFQQITELEDYRDVEGIRYPFKLRQYLGNQTLDFTIESIEVNTGIADEVFVIE